VSVHARINVRSPDFMREEIIKQQKRDRREFPVTLKRNSA
jgi:hypothetical protein